MAGPRLTPGQPAVITYRSPTLEDVRTLYATMRAADRREVEAATGRVDPADLWVTLEGQHEVLAAVCPEGLIAVFGVGEHPVDPSYTGVPWLLGTNLLDTRMITLCKHARSIVSRWHDRFPLLTNFTDKRNRRVILWLRWLGFKFIEGDVPVNGTTFVQFARHQRV
jgi:hypothetical protein